MLSAPEQTKVLNEIFGKASKRSKAFKQNLSRIAIFKRFWMCYKPKESSALKRPISCVGKFAILTSPFRFWNGKKAAKFDIESGKITRMTGMEDFSLRSLASNCSHYSGETSKALGNHLKSKLGKQVSNTFFIYILMSEISARVFQKWKLFPMITSRWFGRLNFRSRRGTRSKLLFCSPSEDLTFAPGIFDLSQPLIQNEDRRGSSGDVPFSSFRLRHSF